MSISKKDERKIFDTMYKRDLAILSKDKKLADLFQMILNVLYEELSEKYEDVTSVDDAFELLCDSASEDAQAAFEFIKYSKRIPNG